ncbi:MULTISPECIES: adenylosuccinate synthase [Sphingobacterium]|jgi:adenylosuccinate synthase|uniref:Adenylosuccinate synthase n=5 Tax=Sphingobacterium TaxID=28453 RepID=A0ACD5C3N3_9SPHI|nr:MULTISPECIES: adenylosuccinate synthase [Sphingobacterium]APU97477.1 adenylosuccinate synthase [Sphingobacterium sp. B29]MBB1643409.1 adenylosuccinate synthase [Sphingobacterium sp. UME9]MCS4165134.1 adenylosuccinate synthase [Sphingobacterium sp. BIGb0116]OFV17109.1 adenylosuccinate synthase [Sphingobacterium sp. HMSC13C05]QMV67588.1 adenylosuccinate synthase [Sphingobacterium paramultivorum]
MQVDVLLGLQWGDEGKGKIVDVFCPKYDLIARFQGGPNAGHTLEFDNKKFVLNTIPSGIFNEGTLNLIGNGVVIDPIILKRELDNLKTAGFDPVGKGNLVLARKAHLILPTHQLLDAASESKMGAGKIGSTLKGIGPTYMDKTGRNGLRVGDTTLPDFQERYQKLKEKHLSILSHYGEIPDFSEKEKAFLDAIEFIKSIPHVDSEHLVNQYLKEGKRVLAEGAQGTLLDVDFGSYPFVTSSNTTTAGACTGLGIAPNKIGKVYGIFKAYATRVGGGPFPTELHDETGEKLRQLGHEFGATTGRARRTGWIDIPALKYAIMLNGVTDLIMMKADVLDTFDKIYACTHYKYNGEVIDYMPYEIITHQAEPILEEIDGWKQDLTGITSEQEIPEALKNYISYLEKALEVPITILSVGPDRKQTLALSK